MWKTAIALLVASVGCLAATAQNAVWSPDVANIVYNHCSSCHHEGSIGPFPLMSYTDAVANAWAMAEHVSDGHMPPWPADPDYRHFVDENVLTTGEVDAVVNWVLQGTPFGDPDLEPEPPVFPPGGSLLNTIDLQVAIPPYTLQYNTDEYRWFVIPNPFPNTVYVNAIEVFAGLDEVVHHADISYDNTGESLANDLADPLPGFNSNTGSPTYSYYMNAWQPGGNVVRYPPQWGIAVPPGADFVIEIHYGPGAQGQVDSTVMNLEFVSGIDVRPVQVGWLLNTNNMTDGPLVIPANTVQTFHQERTVTASTSFVSICPHMHHVGVSYKVWAETPGGDTIPLIDIPRWDFHWQRYYTFQQVQPLHAGTIIKSEAVYDNTVNNPDNPHSPPQNMYNGSTTDSEMFLCYFIWAAYEPGDEDIVLDSTLFLPINEAPLMASAWAIHPQPAQDAFNITLPEPASGGTTVELLDPLGRTAIPEQRIAAGSTNHRSDISRLPPGTYVIRLITPAGVSARTLVKR